MGVGWVVVMGMSDKGGVGCDGEGVGVRVRDLVFLMGGGKKCRRFP